MYKLIKAKWAAQLLGCLTAVAAWSANAITYTYPNPSVSCSSISIKTTGEITCVNTGGAAKFFFLTPFPCSAGLAIDSAGRVSCATTTPVCTLSAPPGPVAPNGVVSLTANCSNSPTGHTWTSTPELVPASNIATVTIPPTEPAGYHSYTVMASNDSGSGNSASIIVKVAVPGQSGPFAYIPVSSGSISVLDTISNTAKANTVSLGLYPVGVAVHPSGILAYVTNEGHNTVSVINTINNKLVTTVDVAPAGLGPKGIAITPDRKKVYVANYNSDNVSVIDAATYKVLKTVPVGSKPVGVAVAVKPDGTQQVYVANSGSNNVSVIDVATDQVAHAAYTDSGPYGVAVKPDGTKVFVTNSISHSVTEIDTSSYGSAGIPLRNGDLKPQGIAVNPAGTQVYVVNSVSGTVSVIETGSHALLPSLTGFGTVPYNVAFNQTGSLAYVTNSGGSSVSIIDTAMRAVVETLNVGGSPYALGQFVGPASTYRGLWYNPNESGWGMSITQHGSMIFNTFYTYDQDGLPTWYVMSSCPLTGTSCTGEIYRVTGGTLPTAAWNGAGLAVGSVGSGTLTFADANTGTFGFTINGVAGSKTITRQDFATGATTPNVDYTDLWWNPNESGWGVALTHQFGTIFATWYVYDAGGKAIWYVASNCVVAGSGCSGDLYKVTGGTSLTSAWNGANKVVTAVGTITFTFTDANTGAMSYSINGVAGNRDITRQGF